MASVDIVVFILAVALGGFTLYRAFFRKKEKAGVCGCSSCAGCTGSCEPQEYGK